jgi:hypothetical protein
MYKVNLCLGKRRNYALNLNYNNMEQQENQTNQQQNENWQGGSTGGDFGRPNGNENSTENENDQENDIQEETPDQQTDDNGNPDETNRTSEEPFESSELDIDESTGNPALD